VVVGRVLTAILLPCCGLAAAQSSAGSSKATASASTSALEREFFAAIRDGDTKKFLAYVPEGGVNFGPQVQHVTRGDVEQQLLSHRGLYCQLFDSSCIDAAIKLDASDGLARIASCSRTPWCEPPPPRRRAMESGRPFWSRK